MHRYPLLLALLFALLSSGCNQQTLIQSFVSDKDRSVAQYYIDLLRNRDLDPIIRDIDPSLQSPNLYENIAKAASLLPNEAPVSSKIIGFNTWRSPEASETNITFEYEYPESWVAVNVATRTTASGFSIIGMNVNPLPDSLENLNRFSLLNKGVVAYILLAFAILIPLFTIYALIRCIMIKPEKRWLWILFILFGFGSIAINWTSGELYFNPLSFYLLGVSAFAQPYGPWVISVSLPLGAIIFLLRQKRKKC